MIINKNNVKHIKIKHLKKSNRIFIMRFELKIISFYWFSKILGIFLTALSLTIKFCRKWNLSGNYSKNI